MKNWRKRIACVVAVGMASVGYIPMFSGWPFSQHVDFIRNHPMFTAVLCIAVGVLYVLLVCTIATLIDSSTNGFPRFFSWLWILIGLIQFGLFAKTVVSDFDFLQHWAIHWDSGRYLSFARDLYIDSLLPSYFFFGGLFGLLANYRRKKQAAAEG